MRKIRPRFDVDFLRDLAPNYSVEIVDQIDEKTLINQGIKAFAFDADSTLVEPDQIKVVDSTLEFLASLTLPIFLTTNRIAPRGDELGQLIKAQAVIHANAKFRKPQARYFQELLVQSAIDLDKTVMVGDRILTDIYGANRAGMTTIYVKALGVDPWYIRYSGIRYLENLIIKFFSVK